MLVAGAAASTWQAVRANRERDRAVAATHEANAQKLVAFASASMAEDPERSITLAMHAVNATMAFGQGALPAAETALHAAIMASRVRLTLHGHQDSVESVVFSPDGTVMAYRLLGRHREVVERRHRARKCRRCRQTLDGW